MPYTTGENVLDAENNKKIIKVNDVRVHLQEIKSLIEGIIRTGEQGGKCRGDHNKIVKALHSSWSPST